MSNFKIPSRLSVKHGIRNGGMTEWRNGGMAEWRNGGMAEWRNDGLTEWRNGGMRYSVFYR